MDKAAIAHAVEGSLEVLRSQMGGERVPEGALWPLALHDASAPVATALEQQPEFAKPLFMRLAEGGRVAMNPERIAATLLRLAYQGELPTRIAERLERALGLERANVLHVAALWGVTVPGEVRLTPHVCVVPFCDVPDSAQKRAVVNEAAQGAFLTLHFPEPSAALLANSLVDPLFADASSLSDHESSPQESFDLQRHVANVRLALTAVGPCVPLDASSWANFQDRDITLLLGGMRWRRASHIEVLPMAFLPEDPLDPVLATLVAERFTSLKDRKFRLRLQTALERLNQAQRRLRPSDGAIDLSIAFETLLTPDKGPEISYRLRLRAALLCPPQERRHVRQVLNRCYNVRSDLIHRGEASSQEKDKAVVWESARICAHLIQCFLELGRDPDWDVLELGGGPPDKPSPPPISA